MDNVPMSTLSNIDIEKELIQGNILIFPFKKENIKGASYNFTVGQFAYQVPNSSNEHYIRAYDPVRQRIVLPPKSTVLVATNESLWVSCNIAGTYHSKVKLVSKGIGHIGTTLDPDYLGVSLIALHNLSEREIVLKPEEDTFVSITFHYVKTKSTVPHDNQPGRPDIVAMLKPQEEDIKWLEVDFRNNKKVLKQKLNAAPEFEKLKTAYSEKWQKFIFYVPYGVYILLLVLGISLNGISSDQRIAFFTDKITTVTLGAFIAQIVFDVRRRG